MILLDERSVNETRHLQNRVYVDKSENGNFPITRLRSLYVS